ncbi:MAG: hypothetical protein ACF8XB_01080 [Planctomycetota bacterium JB042]
MSDEILGDRRTALEDQFFQRESERLRRQLHEKQERAEGIRALAAASGLDDEAILGLLIEKNIGPATFAAFSLVPLIEVAWADGKLERAERDAVRRAAEVGGVVEGTPAYELLQTWLDHPPEAALLLAWESFTRALCETLPEEKAKDLQESVLGRARTVADAAGGFLGLTTKISREEQEMLDRLARAFP